MTNKKHIREEIDLLKRSLDHLWDARSGILANEFGVVCGAIGAATRPWSQIDLGAKERLFRKIRISLSPSAFVGDWLSRKGYKDVFSNPMRLQDYRHRWILEMIAQREAML